jgi:dTDP-4-dehydrorhamnose reductase
LILVFGGGGQLGQELTARAAESGVAIMAFDRASADIADATAVAKAIAAASPSLIVNAAAYNAVDNAEFDAAAATKGNVAGPATLAAAARRAGVPLVHISTDSVFDGAKGSPYGEDDKPAPLNAYGRSKLAGEEAVRRETPEHFILRTAWVFSARAKNFLKTIVALAAERDELSVVIDQTSSPTAARDLADAILLLAAHGKGRWGTYHVAGRGSASRHAMASAIVAEQSRFTGRNPWVKAVSAGSFGAAAPRPRYSALDSSRVIETFGSRPRHWRDAVAETVAELFAGKTRP